MSKLIKVLIKELNDIKEKSNDASLDFSNNKEAIYDDLLIPLMNLTNSDSLTALYDCLNAIINESQESEKFINIANLLVKYIMNDTNTESDSNINQEFNDLMLNCVAVFNTIKAAQDNETIQSMNSELTEYINSKFKIKHDESENDSDEVKDKEDEPEVKDTFSKDEDNKIDEAEPILNIVSSINQVDDEIQSNINKIELKNDLMKILDESENDSDKDTIQNVIDEVFAIALSYEKTSDQKWPHHVLKDKDIILNVNGLKAAALFLLQPNSSKNISSEDRSKMAKHILKHYEELSLDKPDRLSKIADNKESLVNINVKEDELKEYAESFDTNIENVSTYIGLFESLLTDLFNSGIIDIKDKKQNNDENTNNSIIPIQLSKTQVEEFLNYFEIMSDDILNILSNDLENMSYKKTDKDLEERNQKTETIISDLNEEINKLNEQINTQRESLEKYLANNYSKDLIDTKFEMIINFIKSTNNGDETLIQFIDNIIEAETERDIGYLTNLGKAFLKSKTFDNTQFIKKSKIINRLNNSDIDKLLGIVDNDKKESGTEELITDRMSKLVEYL